MASEPCKHCARFVETGQHLTFRCSAARGCRLADYRLKGAVCQFCALSVALRVAVNNETISKALHVSWKLKTKENRTLMKGVIR